MTIPMLGTEPQQYDYSPPLPESLTPNTDDMRAQLNLMFGGELNGHHDGKIEIAWTTVADGKHKLNKAELFSITQIEAAVRKAAAVNIAGSNVYVGAALRKPETFPGARASDSDVLGATCASVDCDDLGVAERAQLKCGEFAPSLIVITGEHPHRRAQMWWRLTEPLIDHERIKTLQAWLASYFDGDPTVTNPSRVMRLAGSVAWPAKPGRIAEMTCIGAIELPGPATVSIEHLETAFPTKTNAAPLPGNDNTPQTSRAAPDDRARESSVHLSLGMKLSRTDDELQQLLHDSRVQGQWHDRMLKAVASMIGRGMPDAEIRAACASYCNDGANDPELTALIDGGRVKFGKPNVELPTGRWKPGDALLKIRNAASFAAEYTPADYLVDGLLQTAFLYSLTAQTGVGKTAVALLLSQCVSDGVPFAARDVQAGAVIYCAGENPDELRQRFIAMHDALGRDAASFNIHFLTPETSRGLLVGFDEVVAYAKCIEGGIRCVIVDTAAAFFDGEDENSNPEMGDYARRLRQLCDLPGRPAIIVPCHPIKNPKAREECVPRGGGAFVNEVDGNLILWSVG